MCKRYFLLLFYLFPTLCINAQELVKGKISTTDALPVTGATVTSKQKGTQALTGKTGNFVIAVAAGTDTLLITHVGFKAKEIILPANRNNVLLVTLAYADKELEEVIVSTGIQKLPKERATGSFTLIDKKLFNEQVGTNVLNRLQYVTNGYTALPARATGNPLFTIRGLSTFTQSIAKPLIIVDNFEYQGDLENINPNDIEHVSFLKDAAAGSIWGAKAANGVIVITTKKSSLQKPTRVELNSNVTIAGMPDLFYNKAIAATDFIDLEKYLFEKGFYSSMLALPQHYPLSPVVNLLDRASRGLIPQQAATEQIDALRNGDIRNEYSRYFYRKAVNQQYAVTVSGGSSNMAWLLSTGYDRNANELDAGYTRTTSRLEHVYVPVKKLEISSSITYSQSKTTAGRPAFGSIRTQTGVIAPYTRFADAAGKALPVFTTYNETYLDTAGGGKLLNWNYYPLDDYRHNRSLTQLENLLAVLGVRYQFNPHFNFDVKYRYQRQDGTTETNRMQGSFFTRNLINQFTQINGSSVVYKIPKGDILDVAVNSITAQNFRAQLNYSQKWKKHEVSALVGSETSETITQGSTLRTYGYNADILTFTPVDFTSLYPLYPYGYNSFIPNAFGFTKRNDRFVSVFANSAYTYLNRYTVSLSARRDASNLFGLNVNDQWNPLWSAGVSWDISKEAFYQSTLIPQLRLKLTYGYQGNIDPSKVASTTIRYSNTSPLTFTPWSVVDNYYNPDLKWEQVGMLNTSVEWASRNRRLAGSVEYYEKRMTDLYVATPVESTMGVGVTMIRNAGKMRGRGWDIEVNSLNLTGNFQWNTQFIFNTYTDKITKAEDPASRNAADMVGGTGSTLEGYSIYTYFAFPWAGLDAVTGDPQGYLNGQLSKDYTSITSNNTTFNDLVYVGSLLPRLFGSVGNSFSWKGISVQVRILYKFNYYFRRESIDYGSLVNQSIGHADYALRWQQPGDERFTDVPSFVYPVNSRRDRFYQGASVLATKGDHIRLQYINISYDVKRSFRKLPMREASVYIVANNLGLLWRANKFGIDPDYSNSSIPPARSFAIGVRMSL